MRKPTSILFILLCSTIVSYGQYYDPRKPITPFGQARDIATDLAFDAAKREFYERKRQIDLDRMRQYNEQQRYGVALRLEQQANYRADYAERYYPNSPQARNLRQAATQASMYRAKYEASRQLRSNDQMRRWYGVDPTPTRQQHLQQDQYRQQWYRPGYNRQTGGGDRKWGGYKDFSREKPNNDRSRDTVRSDGKIDRVGVKAAPKN